MEIQIEPIDTETLFEGDLLEKINEREATIKKMEATVSRLKFEVQELKKYKAENTVIRWKESIKWCLEVDKDNPRFFLKTNLYVAKCIAQKHGVEITTDISNKISSTLSFMFNNKELGRLQHNGKSYYGLPEFFVAGDKMETLIEEKNSWLVWLKQ